jgi:ABC-type antimicrobial peptide transport system permease subunit
MIRSLTELVETFSATIRAITNLLLCIAMISLVIGGIGIMNIMLVCVSERTKEIGLRMAVGTRQCDILKQFLMESILLCMTGGIIGIIIGQEYR